MEIKDFLDLAQLGAVGILLYINRDLWKRVTDLQDRIMNYLEENRVQGIILQGQIGELQRQKEELLSAVGKSQEETD